MSAPLLEVLKNKILNLENNKVDKITDNYHNDVNNIKTTGFTYASGDATNIPRTGYSFYITCITLSDKYVYQQATRATSAGVEKYERQCFNEIWTNWIQTSQGSGTFTPTLKGSTTAGVATYTLQEGFYKKDR